MLRSNEGKSLTEKGTLYSDVVFGIGNNKKSFLPKYPIIFENVIVKNVEGEAANSAIVEKNIATNFITQKDEAFPPLNIVDNAFSKKECKKRDKMKNWMKNIKKSSCDNKKNKNLRLLHNEEKTHSPELDQSNRNSNEDSFNQIEYDLHTRNQFLNNQERTDQNAIPVQTFIHSGENEESWNYAPSMNAEIFENVIDNKINKDNDAFECSGQNVLKEDLLKSEKEKPEFSHLSIHEENHQNVTDSETFKYSNEDEDSWKCKYLPIMNIKIFENLTDNIGDDYYDDDYNAFGYSGYSVPKKSFLSSEKGEQIFPRFSKHFDDEAYLEIEQKAINHLELLLNNSNK